MNIELLFFLFFIKHFVCDFPLQAFPYMYRNKGTYGHTGGLLHAWVHGLGTILVLNLYLSLSWNYILLIATIDGIAHYHIDWAKMNVGKKFNLQPNNSEWFWILLGIDQLLHYLTYYFIISGLNSYGFV